MNFFFAHDVVAYNKIVFTFIKTNKPYRYLRVFEIEDGITREFYNDEIKNLVLLEEVSPTSEELRINTLSVDLVTKNEIGVLFQRTLPFKLFRDGSLLGTFFIDISNRKKGKEYEITATDYIGILDRETYQGGLYIDTMVGTIVGEILSDMPYIIDSTLSNRTVSGYLEPMSKREALQRVIFASGGIIDCSRSEKIEIKRLDNTIKSNLNNDKLVSISEKTESITTQINLIEHRYKLKTEMDTLYEETLNGDLLVNFDAPHTQLSINRYGRILESGIHHAKIRGTGDVKLQGLGYDDISTTRTKVNPLVVETDVKKVKEYETTLICNEIDLLDYLNFISKKLTVIYNMESKEKVGDMVKVLEQNARITNLEYDLNTPCIYATAEMEVY